MNLKRVLLVTSVLALVTSSCSSAKNPQREILGLLENAATKSFEYVYTDSSGGNRVEVRGEVEDSFRRVEVLSINGKETLQRVISDDAMSIHVVSFEELTQVVSADPADLTVMNALQAGQWVTDPAGAPQSRSSTGEEAETTGRDPLSDAAQIFRYVRLAIQAAAGVIEFNPDSPEYREEEDPFPHPDEKKGERRFDLIPTPLPRRQGGQFPTISNFRKLALYESSGKIVRILEVIDARSHPDFVRARRTGRNPYLLQLEKDVEEGRGPQKVRPRKMAFEILQSEKTIQVSLPPNAFVGNLQVLFAATSTKSETSEVPVAPSAGGP